MKNKVLAVLTVSVGLLMVSSAVFAHHSGAGNYSRAEWKTISGTVKEFRFVNPHPILFLEVKDDEGNVEIWRAEFHAPARLAREVGWNKNTLLPGDQVSVIGHPYHEELQRPGYGRVMMPIRVKLANGKVSSNGNLNPIDEQTVPNFSPTPPLGK